MKDKQLKNQRLNYFSPISVKLILASVSFAVLLCGIITLMGYIHFNKMFTKECSAMMSQFAYLAASHADGDLIIKYKNSQKTDKEYEDILAKFVEFTNIADLESLSVVVPDTIKYNTQMYIFNTLNARSASNRKPKETFYLEDMADKSKEEIINIKRLMMLGRPYTEYKIDRINKHKNSSVSTSIPIRDQYNNIVAMLTVSKSINEIVRAERVYVKYIRIMTIVIMLIFTIIYGIVLWYMIISPIRIITKETSYFASNNKFSGELQKIHSSDEIGSLSHAIQTMGTDINNYIKEITTITAEKQRISTELNVATKIQSDMLPKEYPPFPERKDFDLYALMYPAKEVGGDLYDYMLLDDDNLLLVVGDVSGKGVPAALFMVVAKTLLDSYSEQRLSPAKIFEAANNQLIKGNESLMFVTCWLGIYTFSTGLLRFVNAGHTSPVLYHEEQYTFLESPQSLVLGVMEDFKYSECSITLSKGDKIFVYTDGVTEAMNSKGELFDTERLMESISKTSDLDAKGVVDYMKNELSQYAADCEQSDDITMMEFIVNK